MVRRCAVPGCTNTDMTILSHRFPRRMQLAVQWASSLQIDSIYSTSELIDKFTICCLHFEESSYRNPKSNHLNVTAVPKQDPQNPRFTNSILPHCDEDLAPINANYSTVVYDEVHDQLIVGEDDANATACFEMEVIEDDGDEPEVVLAVRSEDYFQEVMDALDWERSSPPAPSSPEAIEEILPEEPEHMPNSEVYIISDYVDGLNDVIDCNRSSCDEAEEEANSFYPARNYDAAVQVDRDELERNDQDEEYADLSRSDLISQLKDALASVSELQQKLDNFQDVHSKLQQSMDAFKSLMGNL